MSLRSGLIVGVMLVGLVIWWQTYRFHDCLNVGHSRLYCIVEIGK